MEVLDRISTILKQKGDQIWSVAPESTVYDALSMMADKGVGALLVVDGKRPVGLFSERDYARKIILMGRSSRDTRVSEIMTAPPITISPDCSAKEAMQIMTETCAPFASARERWNGGGHAVDRRPCEVDHHLPGRNDRASPQLHFRQVLIGRARR